MTATVLRLLGKLLLVLLTSAIAAAVLLLTVVPRAVEGAALTVLTGSMEPAIPAGSLVLVRPVDPATLGVGDVITFQRSGSGGAYITHRITEIDRTVEPATFATKGDANAGADVNPVDAGAVRGEVWFSVPQLGRIKSALSVGDAGLALALVGLAGYAATQLGSALRDGRRAGREAAQTHVAAPSPVSAPSPGAPYEALVVVLKVSEFTGYKPSVVAQLLKMDLIHSDSSTFTLAVVRPPEQITELAESFSALVPLHVLRSAAVIVPHALSRSDALVESRAEVLA